MKHVDYWILFENILDKKAKQQFLNKIRSIEYVLTAFEEENRQIKEHFVF